jgi:hypothetical protein
MNLTLNPNAILFLLMDLDDDWKCVSSFLEFIESKHGKAHKRNNCNIFIAVREIEVWLMADTK